MHIRDIPEQRQHAVSGAVWDTGGGDGGEGEICDPIWEALERRLVERVV